MLLDALQGSPLHLFVDDIVAPVNAIGPVPAYAHPFGWTEPGLGKLPNRGSPHIVRYEPREPLFLTSRLKGPTKKRMSD
jgi:hypothetical protein